MGDVVFLGGGDIGNIDSGSFSAYIRAGGDERVLLECGPTTFSELVRHGLVDKITHVALSSSSEYSLGSLASLVARRRELGLNTSLLCSEYDHDSTLRYLSNSGVEGSIIFSTPEFVTIQNLEHGIRSIFLLKLKNANIIYSPDFNIFAIQNNEEIKSALSKPEKCIIIQGVSLEESRSMTDIEELQDVIDDFKNFYAINHNKTDGDVMMSRERYLRSVPSIIVTTKNASYKLVK